MQDVGSEYFPPLDRCLSERTLLISWKAAFIGLSVPDLDQRRDSTLERFLSDKHTTQLLVRPFSAFASPNAQSKSAFETGTAAIHVTPSNKWNGDLDQLKGDALWLSKSVQVDEVSALRIAVIEWQSRPAEQLRCGLSGEEALGAQVAVNPDASASVMLAPPSPTATGFHDEAGRRTRLVKLYLSERRHHSKVLEILVRAGLSDVTPTDAKGKGKAKSTTWVDAVGKTILNARCSGDSSATGTESFLVECIDFLQSRSQHLIPSNGAFDDDFLVDLETERRTCVILEMIHVMQLIFCLVDSSQEVLSSTTVLAWLRFVGSNKFFDGTELTEELSMSLPVLLPPFQALISIVSLVMLKLPNTLQLLVEHSEPDSESRRPYIADTANIAEIHSLLMGATEGERPVASLAIFAWGIILQSLREEVSTRKEARELRQSQHAVNEFVDSDAPTESRTDEADQAQSVFDQVSKTVFDGSGDVVQHLAKSAVDGSQVYNVILSLSTEYCNQVGSIRHGDSIRRMRAVLLELIRVSLEWVQYSPEVLAAVLGVLSGGDHNAPSYGVDPASMFLADDVQLVPKILEMAEARFPYEVLPFLKLVNALAMSPRLGQNNLPFVVKFLTPQTFTQLLPPDFADYDTTREEENQNLIVLRSPLNIFIPRTRLITQSEPLAITDGRTGLCDGLVIQPDTQGQVISEQAPVIVQWMYPYSGLRYLGRLLDSDLPNGYFEDDVPHVDEMRDIVAEIIGLLAALLESVVSNPTLNDPEARMDAAQKLLSDASDGLGRNGDVITVILDHFEAEIQEPADPIEMAGSMDVLISCTRFVRALIPVLPGRVWPFFVRSGLLDMDGTGGRLSDLIGSTEIVTGRYEFLLECIRIFEGLVDEAVDHAIARQCLGSKSRSALRESCGTGISEQVMTKVVLVLTRTLVDVFRSYHNWKFLVLEERLEMGRRILSIFNKILVYTHSIEDTFLSMLVPAAKYLIEVFILPSSVLPVVSLMQMFVAGVDTPQSTLFFSTTWAWAQQMVASLEFCTTLLRVNTLLKQKRSQLEERLFGALPLLVRLYTAFQSYALPVVALLEAMVLSAATAEKEPPSLLGHLGASSARDFVVLLTRGSKPFDDENLDLAIWRLMSAVVSSRQPWFTIYLLTGNAPRNTLQPGEGRSGKKMVIEALDQLVDISVIPQPKALAMLEFVLFAVDYWPWVVADVRGHDRFVTSVLEYLGSMETRVEGSAVRMAALIAEILAVHLHQSQDSSLVQKLLPQISYLVDHGVDVRGYNESLHANLKRNFEERFPGCSLAMFRRTKLQRVEFGSRYYYHMDLAERMLQYDRSWKGARGPGLAEDVARANVNLSLVEAQVLLLSSWRILILELCRNLSSPSLQTSIAKVVKGCLNANKDQNVPEEIFTNLTRVRSDLGFVLMQRLAEAQSTVPDMKTVIFTVWDTIQQSDVNFELALAGGDVDYYRPLLKILFLSLRPLLDNTQFRASRLNQSQGGNPPFMELQPVIVKILDIIVARGFRHLTVAVHDNTAQSSPEDIALVTAILQTTLRIPGVQEILQQQICNRFAEHETARVATTLFSWADQLVIDGDLIYGELAILFLVELSCMPWMAEQLAVEGVLSQLSNANLTSIIRRGIRPLDRPPRLYTIWTRGFLPLCLNLLQAVGAPISPEVSTFLSQFDAQLSLASNSFDNQPIVSGAGRVMESKDFFTMSQAAEVHSLSMIWRIIEFFRQMGASTGYLATEILPLPEAWDPRGLKEDVEYWLARRSALRERLLPIGPVEEESRSRPVGKGGGVEDRFEERFVGELTAVVRLLSADGFTSSRSTI